MIRYLILICLLIGGCNSKPKLVIPEDVALSLDASDSPGTIYFEPYESLDYEFSISTCYAVKLIFNGKAVNEQALNLIERIKEYGPRQRRSMRDLLMLIGNAYYERETCGDEPILQINVDGETVYEMK